MEFFNNLFSKKKLVILFVLIIIFSIFGFVRWKTDYTRRYYGDNQTLQGQLFPNIANTTVETEKNINPFSKVKYEKVTIRIGSLSSEYDDTNQAQKSNNIINSQTLDREFREWLIKAFDKKEAKKIADHMEIYYRNQKISKISY
ncbi:hypothetical protein [Streptococcus uberis]|uniref:hypothetical protein n=1 Tax=Streptococcus uberis TaxID=1349 RepID=UPI00193A1A79|nr:hypothetical protein [Streptococcus uberis]